MAHAQAYARQIKKAFGGKTFLLKKDLLEKNIPEKALRAATASGQIIYNGLNLYEMAGASSSEKYSEAMVATKAPQAIFCLLTACLFHDLTLQLPHGAWYALPPGVYAPKIPHLYTHSFHFSGPNLTEGIEIHRYEGIDLKFYSAAKTVVDLFRYRNKFGLDFAQEALADAINKHKSSVEEIITCAQKCHMYNVIKKYI